MIICPGQSLDMVPIDEKTIFLKSKLIEEIEIPHPSHLRIQGNMIGIDIKAKPGDTIYVN